MLTQVRYQIFLSSTYEDLREERQQATQAILEAGCFPAGMELFPASDDAQWELIKRVIEESDYYVIIVAGRYGSIGPSGLSYTEMEYDFSVSCGVPVLGFVRENLGEISFDNTEKTEEGRRKLEAFRMKVMSRTCRKYSNPTELGMAIMKSLMAEARVRPRTGWIRADQARSSEDIQRERKLVEELEGVQALIESLEREIRDRSILGKEIPQERLSQGEDLFGFVVTYTDGTKRHVREEVSLSWNEILRVIGPEMYGYLVRKTLNYNQARVYPFQDNLEQCIRAKIVDKVQGRKINLQASQVDICVLQLKELGLLMFDEVDDGDGKKFRGVTLTEKGERQLTLLSAQFREPVS